MSNSSPIQVSSNCEEQVLPSLDIESSSKKHPRVVDNYLFWIKESTYKPYNCYEEGKKENPYLKNVEIAAEYKIGESTVSEILKSKDRWLAVDE